MAILTENLIGYNARDMSFGSFDAGESLAEAFSEEMLAWYEDSKEVKKPHPSKAATLV